MTSYTAGTVTVTNGTATVTGALTFWANDAVLPGDLFCRTLAGPFYDIVSINSDTSITLDRAYAAATQAGVPYVILRLSLTRQSNSYVSAAVWDLVSSYGSALSLSASDQVLTLNKGVAADDALIVLRTAGGERWQIGTTGGDDFKVMRSADGSTHVGALTIARASGQISVQAAGTAVAPVIAGPGDPNTGIWFPAEDTLAISTAGAERMRISAGTGFAVELTGSLIAPGVFVNAATVAYRAVRFSTNKVARWDIVCNAVAESGGNDGSHFQVVRFSDAGGSLGVAMSINRSTGAFGVPAVYTTTTASAANMVVAADGTMFRSTSAAKYKTDVQDLTQAARDAVLQLRPVSYLSLCDGDDPAMRFFGLIAEEVYAVAALRPLVALNNEGEPEGVMYERLTAHLTAMAQHHDARLSEHDATLTAHANTLTANTDTLTDHEARIAALEAA